MPDKSNINLSRDESTKLKRERIVHSALECFALKGFHQTSIRDIAGNAGVSLGNLYNYFDSKEALILEIVSNEADDIAVFERMLADSDEPQTVIERFTNAYLNEVTQPYYAVLATEIFSEAMRNRDIAKKISDNRLKLTNALANVLVGGIERKVFDKNLKSEIVAELILDVIEGLGFRAAMQGKKVNSISRKILQWNIQKIICSA